MARPRDKNSKRPFANIGLERREAEELELRLGERGIPYRQLARMLVREWLKENRPR